MEYGKTESLCLLRKAIARYHAARQDQHSRRSLSLLKDAEVLVQRSMAVASPKDIYYQKNKRETEKYLSLIQPLILKVRRGAAENAPKGL